MTDHGPAILTEYDSVWKQRLTATFLATKGSRTLKGHVAARHRSHNKTNTTIK